MRVENWMERDFSTIDKGATVRKAKEYLEEEGTPFLIVVDEKGKFEGILDKNSLINTFGDEEIEEYLTLLPITAMENDYLEEIAMLMMDNHIPILPVVDDDEKVIGVITDFEILNALLELSGIEEHGIRITVNLKDKPGELKKVLDILSAHNLNVISVLTYRRSQSKRTVMIRVSGNSVEEIARILKANEIDYEDVSEDFQI
ncbi:MAG: CBS domain-containing protein [Thermotogae bacterium]|nr:CBS domain-containing protein [Thermotogota bacterium]